MVALTKDGISVSTNSGADWTLATNRHAYWNTVAGSADGTKWIAVGSKLADTPPSSLYISTDSGTTWQSNSFTNPNGWWLAASSTDGTKFAVAPPNGGPVYTSTNSGATWTLSATGPPYIWAMTTSADSSKLVVSTTYPYRLLVSQDWGATWVQVAAIPVSDNFGYLVSSADGNTLIGSLFRLQPYVYLSFDGGTTWTKSNLPASVTSANGVAVSADGSRLMATANNGIYVLQRTPQPRLNIAAPQASLKLSWTVPTANFVPQQKDGLTQSGWTPITNVPTLNFTNLQNEVTLPSSGGSSFYRLIKQ
jgi:photosystem II stability/assembly factor-like uncharacterized protein